MISVVIYKMSKYVATYIVYSNAQHTYAYNITKTKINSVLLLQLYLPSLHNTKYTFIFKVVLHAMACYYILKLYKGNLKVLQ